MGWVKKVSLYDQDFVKFLVYVLYREVWMELGGGVEEFD